MSDSNETIDENIIEKLAAIEHERWADWQKYLHSKLAIMTNPDNGVTLVNMAKPDWDHWERQINTKYEDLSEKEKQSDRDEVMRYWPVIAEMVKEIIGKDDIIHQSDRHIFWCETGEKSKAAHNDLRAEQRERARKMGLEL